MTKYITVSSIEKIIQSMSSKLRKFVREAYIFGSVVEGCAIAGESDLDLLVVPDKDVDFFSLLEEEMFELLDLGIVLHLHIASNVTYKRLLEEVRQEGIKIV